MNVWSVSRCVWHACSVWTGPFVFESRFWHVIRTMCLSVILYCYVCAVHVGCSRNCCSGRSDWEMFFFSAVVAPTCVCCGLPATHPLRTKYRSHKHIILPFIFRLLLILLLFESPIILCMVAFICGLLCRSHWFQVSFVCARMWCLLHMLVSNRSNVVAVRVVGCCVFVCYSFSVERVSSCVFGLSECVWVCVKE